MRQVSQVLKLNRWLPGVIPLCLVGAMGCTGVITQDHGTGGSVVTGVGGGGGTAVPGTGGTFTPPPPCTGASDDRLIVAPQRIIRLTRSEVLNTIKAILYPTRTATSDMELEAAVLCPDPPACSGAIYTFAEGNMRFPPIGSQGDSATISVDADSHPTLDRIAQRIGEFIKDPAVPARFGAITGCPTTPTDTCATTYLNGLAARAYRRPLTTAEQTRLTAFYNKSKSHMTTTGWLVTATIPEATSNVVYGIFSSPQLLWRSEIGNAAMRQNAPAGIPLTDYELATLLSYFLTDGPPDAMLTSAAAGGTLRANLATQASRILGTAGARTWLTTQMFTYFRLNNLYGDTRIDPGKFPEATSQILVDMHDESRRFLESALWTGSVKDLVLSRTTFLNSRLATIIYKVPVPAGALADGSNFVQTTLPAERTGILTNAAYVVATAGSDRESIVQRGLRIKGTLLCLTTPPPPEDIGPLVAAAKTAFEMQTGQEQVKARRDVQTCANCHANFDGYGLVIHGLDNLARPRTTETVKNETGGDRVVPIDSTTALPTTLGGGTVTTPAELAQRLGDSDVFLNCMARNILQGAMGETDSSTVDMPTPPDAVPPAAGCAALDVTQRFKGGTGMAFADLVRATIASPAFALRRPDQ